MTLQPATPTPFLQNSSVAQSYRRLTISSTSTGSTPINAQLSRSSQQPEKMAASLLAPPPLSQLAELNLSAVPKAVLYSLGTDSSLLRELPLLWGVDKLMEVIPTGWKKVLTSVHHSVTLHTHIHTLTHTLTHMHATHTHTYIHTYTHSYIHTHTLTHIHTLIHTHTHSHTYTHTYTHIQNVVLERLKKHGLESPFALFIQEESNKMTQCLQAIHSSLQVGGSPPPSLPLQILFLF